MQTGFQQTSAIMFRRIFFVYLTHIICFATAIRTASDIRYYVSSNILRIFAPCRYNMRNTGIKW